jgi:hypothetical protein
MSRSRLSRSRARASSSGIEPQKKKVTRTEGVTSWKIRPKTAIPGGSKVVHREDLPLLVKAATRAGNVAGHGIAAFGACLERRRAPALSGPPESFFHLGGSALGDCHLKSGLESGAVINGGFSEMSTIQSPGVGRLSKAPQTPPPPPFPVAPPSNFPAAGQTRSGSSLSRSQCG